MTDEPRPEQASLPLEARQRIDSACLRFEDAWQSGERPQIEDFLVGSEGEEQAGLLRELLLVELDYRRRCDEQPGPEEYRARFPNHEAAVRAAFAATDRVPASTAGLSQPGESSRPERSAVTELPMPGRIGRYLVRQQLGGGAFAVVYQAYDPELERDVALKVPRPDRLSSEDQARVFYEEARTAALVRHPGIVAIHDILRGEEGVCVVQEYVAGPDLASWLQTQPCQPGVDRIARLVIEIAEAVSFAHRRGLVHRDIKPANILIDSEGRPRVTDFGLALRESAQHLHTGEMAGTPSYMSPEQVRGESHRLDGRSDIWSLGVILYEMLTGRPPFSGRNTDTLFDEIEHREPRPPRQIVPSLPVELERICLKCLSKRITHRYSTAADLAEDLRHWRRAQSSGVAMEEELSGRVASAGVETGRPRIVPKGLRSFDAGDTDFFLELLPGPRDRDGLPESIRFWKTRVEETDPDKTFSVGLMYGPSGCGKSSLVKAGLLPRLASHVVPVYVETTPADTESRLLGGLHRHCPATAQGLSLARVIGSLREGLWIPSGNKVLLVLDQFEQWLHGQPGEQASQLVDALRQCDGGRVQSILLVRDDFWLAVSRLFSELEVPLLQDQNSALVDLFDVFHARKVLADFGRAFGRLPEAADDLNHEQEKFLQQAVGALAPDGKVICVRLALFAEMLKGRLWSPTTLKQVGGAEGVGVAFLDETFNGPSASPDHRVHENAARSVLEALLPKSGADIKPHMRSYDDLLAVSGYAHRSENFDTLVRILDRETRLITPAYLPGVEIQERDTSKTQDGEKHYQLTHDYLVGPLREWLTRKRKETRRGRAELRLAERSEAWNAKPENRHLPAWWEDLHIRLLTRHRDWTKSQRHMMRRSGHRHGVRGLALLAIFVALVWGSYETFGFVRAGDLISNLTRAEIGEVPECIRELQPYRRWAGPRLARLVDQDEDTKAKLHAALALVEHDASQKDFLSQQMLHSDPKTLEVIRERLELCKVDPAGGLWKTAHADAVAHRRFNAACALASSGRDDGEEWEQLSDSVSRQLVETLNRNPRDFGVLVRLLAPVRLRLAPSLAPLVYDRDRSESERNTALSVLMELADDQPALLADVLMEATPEQFARLYPLVQSMSADAAPLLEAELRRQLATEPSEAEKERLGQRQARAAIALLRLNRFAEVRPLLKFTPDPRARSYFIHWVRDFGVEATELAGLFVTDPVGEEVPIQRALLLSLGTFPLEQLPQQQPLVASVLGVYRAHSDPGIHAAAAWSLRQWGRDEGLKALDEQLKESETQLRSRPDTDRRRWYVNSQGVAFVIVDAGEFTMGSPESETDREAIETRHVRQIGRTFAISATEVMRKHFQDYLRSVHGSEVETIYTTAVANESRTEDSPAIRPTWFDAAEYCNWLSKSEGIPRDQWCYEPNEDGEFYLGMKPARDYLTLTGYRLPTEAEWEYACRAGAVTGRHYGESAGMLSLYGWYEENSDRHVWPVAVLQPNDFGLFDMLGNVHEWCHERYQEDAYLGEEPLSDVPDIQQVEDRVGRVSRGGAFRHFHWQLRSAYRGYGDPDNRSSSIGFRPARTYRGS